jgi:hypothetical protein
MRAEEACGAPRCMQDRPCVVLHMSGAFGSAKGARVVVHAGRRMVCAGLHTRGRHVERVNVGVM